MGVKLIVSIFIFSCIQQTSVNRLYIKCSDECLHGEKIVLQQNSDYLRSYYGEGRGGKNGKIGYWLQRGDTIILKEILKDNKLKESEYLVRKLADLEFLISYEESRKWLQTSVKIDSIFSNSESLEMLSRGRFPSPEMKEQAYNKAKSEELSHLLYPYKAGRDIYILKK